MKKTNKPITVYVTAKEKRRIARMAKDAGISLEEFIRRAATSYIPLEKGAMLEKMTELLNQSTARADSAIDDALAYVEASNLRISVMENRDKSETYERKLVLKVNVPAGMDKPQQGWLAPAAHMIGPMAFFKSYPANAHGVDFVVGDLHGHREQLLDELERLGFDSSRDRLFCTGDLIDRGPDSLATLKLILEPWFYSVRGNHEDELPIFLEYQYGAPGGEAAARETGQDWVYRLSEEEFAYLRAVLLPKIQEAPLVLRVEGESGFWMTHADRGVFGSYASPIPLVDDERLPFITEDNQLEALLWSRRLLRQIPRHELTDRGAYLAVPGMEWENGVGLTFVGHSYVPKPVLYRSHFFLDTGAGTTPSGRLTVLQARKIKNSARNNERC